MAVGGLGRGSTYFVSFTEAAFALDIPPNPEMPTPVAAARSPKSLLVNRTAAFSPSAASTPNW
jgi:hypothetical protein